MNNLLSPFERVLDLFFPPLCLACRRVLSSHQQQLCLSCQLHLPYTSLHEEADNIFTQRFWGRLPLQGGAACFYFVKGGRIQPLIHRIKYQNQPELAKSWGRIYAKKLLQNPLFEEVDCIVPVPLHWKKRRIRGFNQAAMIGAGLAEGMDLPMFSHALEKTKHNITQTHKSRLERLQNVMDSIKLRQPDQLKGRHILLVDDVMTSGATLEACALPILDLPATKVSMVTLAIAI